MAAERWLQWLVCYLTVLALLSIGAALHELHQWRKETRMSNDDQDIGTPQWWGIFALVIALLLGALVISGFRWPAYGRDLDGRYQHAENHEWFKSLHASGGHWCCDISDGHAVADVDWRSRDGHYQVNLEDQWVDVPEDALIKVPNIDGRTFVWPGHVDGKPIVNCFMPGSMT